jgi:flagellar hook-length control protein FliK
LLADGTTEPPAPLNAELAPSDDQATTAPPESTTGSQTTDPQGLAIAPANTELAAPTNTTAPQTADPKSQDNSAALDPLAAQDTAAAAPLEISPVAPPDEKGKDKSDANKSSKSDLTQIPDSQIIADATASPLDQPPAATATQDAATIGIQAAVAPQPAPQSPAAAATPPTGAVHGLTSRLPSHVLAQAESHHGRAAAPVVVDSARFLNRVAKAFLSAQQRDGEVRLRLSPPELGSLRLQVSVQDGVMVARMETETEAARTSLTNNLPELRERLAEQGIRIERFDIDLMQQPSLGTPDRPSDSQQQSERQPLRSLRTDQAKSEAPTLEATTSSNWSGQGRLNVII